MSSARRPWTSMANVSSACASFMPPRPTYGWSGATSSMRASIATGAPAFEITCPSTVICHARISARARSRDGERPRSTTSRSRRVLRGTVYRPRCHGPRGEPAASMPAGRAGREGREHTRLAGATDDPLGDGPKPARGQARVLEDDPRVPRTLGRESSGPLDAEDRRVAWLPARRVLARALAERRRVALDVEHVVDDLKREPELGRVLPDRGQQLVVGSSHDGAALGGRGDQGAGLSTVHAAQAVGVERQLVPRGLTGRLQVDGLAAHHARWSGGLGNHTH